MPKFSLTIIYTRLKNPPFQSIIILQKHEDNVNFPDEEETLGCRPHLKKPRNYLTPYLDECDGI
jgi:hypothetical protein